MGGEDRVLGQRGTNPEPPRCRLHARGRLALWMLPLDPAEKRERAEERHEPGLELPRGPGEQGRDERRGGEHREDRASDGLARQPARLCVGDDPGDETAHPSRRLVLRAGGERLGRNDAVERADAEMVENAALVGRQPFVARLSEPHVEDARAALLDVDHVARGEVDQRRGHGVVGHAEAVRQEVHDRRRLARRGRASSGRPGAPAACVSMNAAAAAASQPTEAATAARARTRSDSPDRPKSCPPGRTRAIARRPRDAGDGRTTRTTGAPSMLWTRLSEPPRRTCTIVIGLSEMSPLASNPKLPRRPFSTRVRNSSSTTERRVPSERAMASSRTSAACAA